eukprot:m.209891 g.209891  ORF g.209891 m.209891 type:complete len:289 (-) comp22102_c1_seq15:333-1199(-)
MCLPPQVSTYIWLPGYRWKYRDSDGFALEEAQQTGDWQRSGDGYGNWGNVEENGGVIMSTFGLVLDAGVYKDMYKDFRGLVVALDSIAQQLRTHNASAALDASHTRHPIQQALVRQLCANVRPASSPQHLDWWGAQWCFFYKSVSHDLPEAGYFLGAFVHGLLDLDLLTRDPGLISIHGTLVPLTGQPTAVPLPPPVAEQWPTTVHGLDVALSTIHVVCNATTTTTTLPKTAVGSLSLSELVQPSLGSRPENGSQNSATLSKGPSTGTQVGMKPLDQDRTRTVPLSAM